MNAADIDPMFARSLYDQQLPVLAMAARLGCSRPTVVKVLLSLGLAIRDRSASNSIRMTREGAEGRARLTIAAHDAVRGMKRSITTLERGAASRARNPKLSVIERAFLDAFNRAGLRPVPQHAIGKFNVDFAFPDARVAVEIDPGHWHTAPRKAAQDTAKSNALRGHRWKVIRWSGNAIRANNPKLADVAAQFVAGFKLPRLDPSP